MASFSGVVTALEGVRTLDVTPNDVITFTPVSGTYTVEYPIGSEAISAASTAQSITANTSATQMRVLCISGSVAYANVDRPDAVGSGFIVAISGGVGEGNVLTASLFPGYTATSYQWLRNGDAIPGAASATYTQTSADVAPLGQAPYVLTVQVTGLGSISTGVKIPSSTSSLVGGYSIGDAGLSGSIYEGYTLSFADDFNTFNLLTPANPRGRWWTTRTYLPGARGSDTLLGTIYDTDPFMTGYNDSNRGVPVGYSNMTLASSVLNLQARKATSAEQIYMQSSRNEVAAMISGAGAVHWYPSAAGSGDIVYEARMRLTAAAGNPAGWHPTLWLTSLNPVLTFESDELDWEGNSQSAYFYRNVWTSGTAVGTKTGSGSAHDGNFHTITFIINTTNVRVYVDGSLYATGSFNGNSKSKPQFPYITSHIYNGTFEGDAYSQAAWNADGDGATLSVDWMRVWRRTGRSHFAPLASLSDVNVNYGGTTTITFPSAATLWGDGSVTEYLQAVYNEENEPGVTHSSIYTQFPPGVSYNAGTRQLTVAVGSGSKTGRINFVMSAWKTDGSTGEPLRFAVNVGPRLAVSSLSFDIGASVSYDLYAACECGVLTTNGTSKAKTISVTGLGLSGLSYNDTTGLLTGTSVAGTYSITVSITNSVGQTSSTTIPLTIATQAAYTGWTADGVGWFDASDPSGVTLSGTSVLTLVNKRSGQGDLVGGGAARTLNTAAKNGLNTISVVRDISSGSSLARFSTSASSDPLSTMFQGNDKPYTVLMVYQPTDTNTGYLWSASADVDVTDSQQIAAIRRNATASSVRRQLVTATSNDVNFGTGQAANAWRVLAVKHTGTAVSVWDTSTTAAVTATAQDTTTFGTALNFRIGAASTNSGVGNLAPVACAMDFAEIVIQNTARSDADIQQAITDLASKWAITLS